MASDHQTESTEALKKIAGARFTPATVSAPDIHYTTTVDAKALVQRDSVFFVAFNKSREKRVLHVLSANHYRDDGFDFYKQRPLYLEDCSTSHGSTSVFDLLSDKFDSDDAAHLQIFHPPPGFSGCFLEWRLVRSFEEDLRKMAAKLPFQPMLVEWWELEGSAKYLKPGEPRVFQSLAVTATRDAKTPIKLNIIYSTPQALGSET